MATITEKYPAIVTSTDDPKKLGRIKVSCSQLSGDEDALPDFINPCFDWGWFYVPDVGEEVEIEVVAHDAQEESYEQAFLEEPDWRWRGKRFASEQGEQPRLPEKHFTKKNYGKRRGFATPAGHFFLFDDTDGDELITMTLHRKAAGDYSFVSIDKDGSILLSNRSGGMLFLNAATSEVALVDGDGGNLISMKRGDGIKLIDQNQNLVQLKDGVIQILAKADVVVQGGANVTIKAAGNIAEIDGTMGVNLGAGGSADSNMVRGTDFAVYMASKLSVLTALGPSGPAIVPLAPGVELSLLAKVK